jgi:glycosyltransferase involved in cell wall biosynthesis
VNLTIGITTCNRLKYSQAQKKSLEKITSLNEVETILVDNGSSEKGFEKFLDNCEKSYEKVFRRKNRDWINDEYHAKNTIIENATSDIILFLQDDLQFIGDQEILFSLVDDFRKIPVMCLDVNGVRKITLQNTLGNQYVLTENNNKFWVTSNNHFQTMGLFKKNVFDNLGSYPIDWPEEKEYWGRSEDWYDSNIKKRFPGTQITLKNHVPIFIPVWNDPRGGYAFIRGEKRYGNYLDPVSSNGLYYDHLEQSEYNNLMKNDAPSSFAEVAKPSGWTYSKNEIGDQIKYPQSSVLEEGPENDF